MKFIKSIFKKKQEKEEHKSTIPEAENEFIPVCDIINRLSSQDFSSLDETKSKFLKKAIIALNQPKIKKEKIRWIVFRNNTIECKGIRSLFWRLLLGHFPLNAKEWHKFMEIKRGEYEGFKKEFLITPSTATAPAHIIDHPLSKESNSQWASYFNVKKQMEEIMNDVTRTRCEIDFLKKIPYEKTGETREQIMGRMLLLYTKLNPGIMYVQGMNEILAIIYITITEDTMLGYEDYIESETFFTFCLMMGEIKDNFIRSLDKTKCGVKEILENLSKLLKRLNEKVWKQLKALNVEYEFFALRWELLLLSQEYSVNDVQCLWDLLFSDKNRFTFLSYMIIALVLSKEQVILTSDFSTVIKSLQVAPKEMGIRQLIEQALLLYQQDNKGET